MYAFQGNNLGLNFFLKYYNIRKNTPMLWSSQNIVNNMSKVLNQFHWEKKNYKVVLSYFYQKNQADKPPRLARINFYRKTQFSTTFPRGQSSRTFLRRERLQITQQKIVKSKITPVIFGLLNNILQYI